MNTSEKTKNCKKCGVDKPLSAFHVLLSSRDGKQPRCKECACAATKKWNSDNKEKSIVYKKRYYQDNKAILREKNKIWVRNNPERALSFGRKYRAGNPEKENERAKRYRSLNAASLKESQRRYHEEHPELKITWDAARRAQKLLAMPAWADRDAIAAVYREARKRTKDTGIEWHVDHVVPLNNKLVCGLHVACNLQIITAVENMTKHNRFLVD